MILGFDLAGNTGAACLSERTGKPLSEKLDLNFRAGGSRGAGGDPLRRLVCLRDGIVRFVEAARDEADEPVTLAVVEGYSFARSGTGSFTLAEYGGVLRLVVAERKWPFLVVPPQTLKCFARGEKAAFAAKFEKAQMVSALSGFGGKLDPKADHDRADALWCALLGAFVRTRHAGNFAGAVGRATDPFRTKYRTEIAARQIILNDHV